MLAKLAVVFIVLSSIPVYAAEEAASGIGPNDPLRMTKLEIYVYGDVNNPNTPTNVYSSANPDTYAYLPEEDARIPYTGKEYVYFSGAGGFAPKIRFVVTANRSDVEYEFERLQRFSGEVEFTTGRIAENYYICRNVGNYRIHIYATDGSGDERIYYTHAYGMDRNEPVIESVTFSYVGEPIRDKDNRQMYGAGKVTIVGANDWETGLHEKPYMFDYPNGEWVEGNELPVRSGNYYVATRDKVGNVRTDYVRIYFVDAEPPLTTFVEEDTLLVNGFRRSADMRAVADDETGIPEDYLSLDGENWLSGDTIVISENGVYDVYTRDVFGHVSQNTLEVTNIDKEPPHCSYNIEHISRGGGYSGEERLHVIAVDDKAGLDADAYSYDGGGTWVGEDSMTISENGTYTVRVRDALGNESDDTLIEVSDIDNKRPEIIGISENRMKISGIYAAASKITVEARDDESGLAEEAVFFDERGVWSRDKSLTVSKNGIVNVRVRDRVGNTESSSIKIENIDGTAPECVIRGNPENLTMSKINLTLEVKDPLSGVKSVYMSDARVGVKTLLKEYPCDTDGAGEHDDTIDVEITSNGEYLFYVTDMCGNEKREGVTVTKIIKSKTPSKPEDPADPDEGRGGEGGSGGGGSGRNPGGTGGGPGNDTVVIGAGDSGKTGKNTKTGTGITVRNGSVSEDKSSGDSKLEVSGNRHSRNNDPEGAAFEGNGGISGNELTDAYPDDDFSTDIFESEEDEYYAANSPQELEMIPNPDEIETTEKKPSKAGTIAVTVVLMVVFLSALTVFLLVKKGLITLPDILQKPSDE